MDPAKTLTAAAEKLREHATATGITPGPWVSLDGGDRIIRYPGIDDLDYVIDEPTSNSANAEYIALSSSGSMRATSSASSGAASADRLPQPGTA